jgi:hypothetical protein
MGTESVRDIDPQLIAKWKRKSFEVRAIEGNWDCGGAAIAIVLKIDALDIDALTKQSHDYRSL